MQANSPAAEIDDWDQHWKQFGESSEMGPTPRYRSRLIRSMMNFLPPGTGVRFLEIGSGTGAFAEYFCSTYPQASYVGLELSQEGVDLSRQRVPRARFVQRNLLEPEVSGQFFDYQATHALCSEVLEHLEKPVELLRNASVYLKPGCRLIVTVPGGPMNAFYKHIGHRRHYSPRQLSDLLVRAGFEIESAFGAGFPFFDLFRLLLTIRGEKLVSQVSGPPSVLTRMAGSIFESLFRFNSSRNGWQTFAIARYSGRQNLTCKGV